MSNKHALGHSLDEWMDLVNECRQSGLTDAAWCNEHGISPRPFTNPPMFNSRSLRRVSSLIISFTSILAASAQITHRDIMPVHGIFLLKIDFILIGGQY